MVASPHFGHLEPMLRRSCRGRRLVAPAADGTDRRRGRPGPPPAGLKPPQGRAAGWNGGLYAFMRRALASEHGAELYRQRQPLIEPIFAHTKFNRRIERFPPTRK